jgi:acyl transferase domain-containing protein
MDKRIDLREPIAIVGIGCRFPGGIDSPKAFWSFLRDRGNAIREVPADRWDAAALFHADPSAPGRTYARRGGFLDGIDQFDPQFFGISPREAAHIDPQQRLLLETAHEAMEDAGERWDDVRVRDTGVFVGVFIHDYQHMQFADRALLNAHTGTGTAMSIAANRVSYVFDLHGPSMAVDTACSSSLVAIDLACKAIRNGECAYALAGGVNVILKPEMTIAMSKATMLSKEGTCKSFDGRADGYVRGEGAGMVLLRPLREAIADGNPIYAVIRGSGVNSDGQTKGISVPNGQAQEALSRRVLAEAGLEPSTIDYVEAHGTGTPVGDPIEAGALGRAFSSGREASDAPVMIGSVKTNIGHLESASGVAGLIKAALCLQHRELVANLHFEQPNPAIDFAGMRLQVVTDHQPWSSPRDRPRRAAVNSFGFGGTNAHVILEEAPAQQHAPSTLASTTPVILPMGAHDDAALRALAGQYAQVDEASMPDLLYTVSQRRTHGSCRAALIASDTAQLHDQLRSFAAGEQVPSAVVGQRLEGFSGRPVFVFSGMGPQSAWTLVSALTPTSRCSQSCSPTKRRRAFRVRTSPSHASSRSRSHWLRCGKTVAWSPRRSWATA